MKKLISYSWYIGGVKEFDTETGSVSPAPKSEWGSTGFGSLWRQNGKIFALYRDDESLLLQHETYKWRLTPDYKVSWKPYFIFKNFKIKYQGNTVFSIWYIPKDLFFSLIDPTYDYLDAESDDFFLYVKSMWESWGARPYSEFLEEFKGENI